MFFFPLGGVFVFGGDGSRSSAVRNIILAAFNILMGGISLAIGYGMGLLPFVIIGYIIGGLGLLMLVLNVFGLRRSRENAETSGSVRHDYE